MTDKWITLWGWLLIVGLAGFAVLTVVVAIGGLRDLRGLIQSATKDRENRE